MNFTVNKSNANVTLVTSLTVRIVLCIKESMFAVAVNVSAVF